MARAETALDLVGAAPDPGEAAVPDSDPGQELNTLKVPQRLPTQELKSEAWYVVLYIAFPLVFLAENHPNS
jgi:hypothetical protein